MRQHDAFPGRYISAPDLNGGEKHVTIDSVVLENVSGDASDPEEKAVMSFRDQGVKPLILNRTNWRTIEAMHGEESDAWSGRRITLYSTEVAFRGRMVPCIRVRSTAPPEAAQATTEAAQPQFTQEQLAAFMSFLKSQQ